MDYTFKVTENEANIIINALAELPAKVSMALIANLQQQANAQLNAGEKAQEELPD